MRLRIRKSIEVVRHGQMMDFFFANTGKTSRYEVGEEIVDLVKLLDGSLTIGEVYRRFHELNPEISEEMFLSIIEHMKDDTLVEEVDKDKQFLELDDINRYARQMGFFEEFITPQIDTYEIQKKLIESKVAVFGLGGTGSWVVQSLTQLGIGHLKIFDFDIVDLSNLSRQALYQYQHVGEKKHLVAAEVLSRINPKVKVESFEFQLTADSNIKEYVKDVNLVINCTDFPDVFTTSMWIARQCMELNIPHIVAGGYSANKGMIGPTIIPYQTACWKCYELSQAVVNNTWEIIKSRDVKSIGSINVIAAIVANIQVWEALRVLIGVEPLVVNRKGNFNFRDLSIQWNPFERNSNCPMCGSKESLHEFED